MRLKLLVSTFVVVFFCVNFSNAQSKKGRVMGYIDGGRNDASSTINTMDWANLTDFIYGFVQPDANGNLSDPYNLLGAAKSKAKANNVRIHISSGGGAFGGYTFQQIASNANLRSTFATNVANYLSTNQLDGFDLDWEFPQGYLNEHVLLLQELRSKLNTKGTADGKYYELAIAVGGQTPNQGVSQGLYHTDFISSNAFQYIDMLNLMAYDNFFSITHHSTYLMAQKVVEAYVAKGCPVSKMVLGVPFYGWTANRCCFKSYAELAAADLNTAYNTSQQTVSGTTYYHNGKDLLEQKIDYIMQQGGIGVFSWSINYDRHDQYSLMKLMNDYIKKYRQTCPTPELGADKSLCGVSSVTLDCGINPGSGKTITWTRPGGSTSTGTKTITATTAGTYEVKVDSTGGCSVTDKVIVSADLPTVNIGADVVLCNPATDTLISNVTGNGITYEWKKDNVVQPVTASSLIVTNPGTYRLTVSATGCASKFDEAVVTSTLPTVADQTVCTGSKATFTITSPGSSFSWFDQSTGGTALSTGTTFITPNLNANKTYYVASGAGTSATLGKTAAGSGYQDNATFYAQKLQMLANGTLSSLDVVTSAAGSLTIVILASDGTTAVATKTVNATSGAQTISLDVNLTTGVYFITCTSSPAGTLFYDTGAGSADYTSVGAATLFKQAYTSWSSPKYSGTSTGYGYFFNVKLNGGSTCARKPVTATVSVCTATEESKSLAEPTVYPNPFEDVLVVQLGTYQKGSSKVEVYGIDGNKIQGVIEKDSSSDEVLLKTTSLPQGIYFVRIESEGQVIVRKVTK